MSWWFLVIGSWVPEYVARPYIDKGLVNDFSIQGTLQNIWYAELIYQSEEKLTMAGDFFMQQIQLLEDKLQLR